MVQVLPLQIRLLDNLSQLQYEGKWLTSIIYISQPPSLSFACHPRSRVMHQAHVSQATQFELAQFIKPGPVHKLEFTRRRHLQQTAAAHSWWEGQADVQGKSKGETGESLRASVCQPQWEALHPLLKDRVQLAELAALSCLGFPWFSLSHSKHCKDSTCWQYQLSPLSSLFEQQQLWPLAEVVWGSLHFIPLTLLKWTNSDFFFFKGELQMHDYKRQKNKCVYS